MCTGDASTEPPLARGPGPPAARCHPLRQPPRGASHFAIVRGQPRLNLQQEGTRMRRYQVGGTQERDPGHRGASATASSDEENRAPTQQRRILADRDLDDTTREIEMRALRFIPDEAKLWTDDEGHPIAIVEITANCLQGRYLLRPSPRSTALYLGVLGQAQKLYRFPIFAYAALSTHHHQLIGVRSAEQLSAIMCYVHGNVAKEIGRVIDWQGKFWDRRGVAIPVLSDADSVDRLS